MDEPSTGLDPASRNNLWNVVKEAKRNRAIVLTSTYPFPFLLSRPILRFLTRHLLILKFTRVSNSVDQM